jgi:phage/conjugal plasmid C-4 type zinc finger TraR family protein
MLTQQLCRNIASIQDCPISDYACYRGIHLEVVMATGWAAEGAVQEQIDATVKDGILRAKSQLTQGPGLTHCAECGHEIPEARRAAVAGVRMCVACQEACDRDQAAVAGYNRRGSKDSQLR